MMCRYTNLIEPANRVIWSATLFSRLFLRSSACCSSAGLTGRDCGLLMPPPSWCMPRAVPGRATNAQRGGPAMLATEPPRTPRGRLAATRPGEHVYRPPARPAAGIAVPPPLTPLPIEDLQEEQEHVQRIQKDRHR